MNEHYEKLGAFYLGKEYDLPARERQPELLLLDSKDLTTHAVIIGMTGSGKTGLGIGMLEEAAIDRIPVIAIDPKGDLGNLALTFPELAPQDFAPWVDPQQANTAGQTREQFAGDMSDRWRKGLASWDQDGARIQRLRDAADVTVYTPGSTAGRSLSLLKGFAAPPPAIRDDAEAFAERLSVTATGLLALLDIDADPISSREHILLSNVLQHYWSEGTDLDLGTLIGAIQSPPFAQLGVMPLDTVFPAKDRSGLAMRLNNLLAAPGFQSWLKGEPLDTQRLLYTNAGKPRVSVLSIAHLNDAERMFFVTLVLADLIGWMRQQPGTGSLRALLYIDELFGYMPPVANPPSKRLLLTLLKQARAFGVGVVLSTQNPVDLDYKGLANTGLWFLGRLQTERDKARVMDGLAGASSGGAFDRGAMERTLSGLGKRVFLMHSIYENAPTVFETRWAMSYLAGPMTRDQLRALDTLQLNAASADPAAVPEHGHGPTPGQADATAPVSGAATRAPAAASAGTTTVASDGGASAPILPPEIPQLWLPTRMAARLVTWRPAVLGVAQVAFQQAKLGVNSSQDMAWLVPLDDNDQLVLDWGEGSPESVDVNELEREARPGAAYVPTPAMAAKPRHYAKWARSLKKHIRSTVSLSLFKSAALKLVSEVEETEGAFRVRLQQAAREAIDARKEKLRARYALRLERAREKVRRTAQTIETRESAATQAKLSTAVSIGSAVLGALFGRKKLSATAVNKIGTATRSAGRARERAGSVERAEADHQAALDALAELEQKVEEQLELEQDAYDALADELTTVEVRPRATDVEVQVVALAWVPWVPGDNGALVRG